MRNILSNIVSISRAFGTIVRDKIAIRLLEAQEQTVKSAVIASHVVKAKEASRNWQWDEAARHLEIAEHIKKTW